MKELKFYRTGLKEGEHYHAIDADTSRIVCEGLSLFLAMTKDGYPHLTENVEYIINRFKAFSVHFKCPKGIVCEDDSLDKTSIGDLQEWEDKWLHLLRQAGISKE